MTSLHTVTLCLLLVALACTASLLQRVIRIPLPFMQIAVGAAAALPPFGMTLPLDPDTFLLLFLPLLLFGDGWRLPRRGLSAMPWSVLGYAVGLVLLTTLAGGYALHWLIPEMPLSVAFAVAALVSPTDAVAVAGITRSLTVPTRMKHLLESESLLNDASGLVAMRIAVAATLSGGFSIFAAAGDFLWVAASGIAIGVALASLYHLIHRRFLKGSGDATLQTVLTGLLPFAAFAAAEEVDASGILAAVAAGITASRLSLLEHAHFSARIMTGATWDVVSFCLNGTIFVLLGLQLPGIIGAGPSGIDLIASQQVWAISDEILELTAVLIALRFLWIFVPAAVSRMLGSGHANGSWRVVAASSIAGVRGAVTLAGALSIPLAMPDGAAFPYRDFAITIAVGVILISMLVAAIGLPLLLRGIEDDHRGHADAEMVKARRSAIEAAISSLSGEPNAGARGSVLAATYRTHLAALSDVETSKRDDAAWRDLHRTALHAERDAIQRLRHGDEIDDAVARQLLYELDILEAAVMHRPSRPHFEAEADLRKHIEKI
jgi:CPA1 family monovalent cation:H+ antiporter